MFLPYTTFEVIMAENNLLMIIGFQNAPLCSLAKSYEHLCSTICLCFPAYLSKNTTSKAEDPNHVNTRSVISNENSITSQVRLPNLTCYENFNVRTWSLVQPLQYHNNNMKRKLCQIIHTKGRYKVENALPFRSFHHFLSYNQCNAVVLLVAIFRFSPCPSCNHPPSSSQGVCDLLTLQAKHVDTLITEFSWCINKGIVSCIMGCP
jgi:hypothetical protein